jgi:TP901 family phage tail tape measure protein
VSIFTTNWQIKLQDLISPGLGKVGAAASVSTKSIAELRREVAAYGKMRVGVKDPLELAKLNRNLDLAKTKIKELQALGTGPRGIGGGLKAGLSQGLSQLPGIGGFIAGAGSTGPLGAALLAVGAGVTKAASMALDFDTALGKINTTAQLTRPQLRSLGNEILSLSASSTTGPIETANAYEKIISATGDARLSVDILKASLKGAQAGFADVNTVADSIVNTLNSFGADRTNPMQVLESLLATKRVGKGEFNDIAANMSSVAANAKNVNASLFEMGGAFASLTSAGFSAEESGVRLSGIYRGLADPERVAAFKSLGVSIFDQQGKYRGLVAVVGDLRKSLAGLTDEQRGAALSSLGLDSRAAAGLSTFIENYDRLKTSVTEVSQSQGELTKTLEYGQTAGNTWAQIWSATQVEMLKWGQDFLPLIKDIGAAFVALGPAVKVIGDILRVMVFTVIQLTRLLLAVAGVATGLIQAIATGGKNTSILSKSVGAFGNIATDIDTFSTDLENSYKPQTEAGSPKAPAIAGFKAVTPGGSPASASLAPAPGGPLAKSTATGGSSSGGSGGAGRSVVMNIQSLATIHVQRLDMSLDELKGRVTQLLVDEARNGEIILSSPTL